MEWLVVTLQIYRQVCVRAAMLAAKNWPVLGSLFVYLVITTVAAVLCSQLGIAGGFIVGLVRAACLASFLYLVEMIVRTSRVTLNDFRHSFGPYLWDVVGIMFLFWIFTLASPIILQLPQGEVILLFAYVAIFVLFNAVPELIYMGHHTPGALLSESYQFIAENWLEWFPATIIAIAIMYGVASLPIGGVGAYAQAAVMGLLLYFTMVMRGLLFIELHGSTHRGRVFKYRMGGWSGT
ncbi:MAG: hypothetical protein ACHQ9S_04355 [Candidatus Binatia bacterium]